MKMSVPHGFALAGGLAVLFTALPVAAILFSTPAQDLAGALSDREILDSLGLTFAAGALATLIGLVGGIPLAYLLARRRFSGKRLVEAIIDLPVVLPHTAAGVALLGVFGREGLLGGPLRSLGLVFTDSLPGIVVAMLFVSLPFLVNTSREAFALVDPELERVALIDGASPWQAFRLVTLPQAARGVAGGALMMWSRGISEFGAVVILAYHPKIVPTLVFERFQGFGLGAAREVAVIQIVAVLAVFILLRRLLPARHDEERDEKREN